MPYTSKRAFLKSGTKPTTNHKDECPICQNNIPTKTKIHHFSAHVLHMHKAAKVFCLGAKPVKPRVSSSRHNYMTEIKSCGHCFCFDCLETWLEKSDTCPMCRASLFSTTASQEKGSFEMSGYASEREFLEIRDMGAPAVRDMVSEDFTSSIGYMEYVPGSSLGISERVPRGCMGLKWRVLVRRRGLGRSVVFVEGVSQEEAVAAGQ
ncbi:E3 ubiquitin-protein ligase ATL59 [Pyrenophora tritici-repentis]|uniref:E3 ubiquitin-protein ligase ATL59 n=1 Tax=Pyrenophora tritici-repentis TaxID=45151 RepID=A0A2W1HXW6_9PLEO|nr:E3 ubiquitin-protein ligase ATL59 [Pyrenophora tritici-repentis]KAF7574313.1 HRD1, HRD ubiquitin ligase complex, ER membrane component [Pyrenophora tritici-repentis]KAI0575993.1 E3 ubiquitin-protein ligase ATL59-like [Pyrenophora tritici-repentis]KAI1518406.1 E3 ubiquitin-protein ligase ATL59 [Pyrenophora tritici-repentis]KAI1590368.1 HRD1 HRD ubiquitin ligase complex ER membrane component [Pyrenophora tritici-repentis]